MKNLLDNFLKVLSNQTSETKNTIEHNWTKNLHNLEKRIDYKFNNIKILKTALTHDSYLNQQTEEKEIISPAERMEFLGDSILGLVVAEELFIEFPDKPEGILAKKKSKIVSEKFLSIIAKKIDLGKFIRLSEEEEMAGGKKRKSILADSMESLICAIYLDKNFAAAKRFIKNFILTDYKKHIKTGEFTNYKSILQEYSQSIYHITPIYKVIDEKGPEHDKIFCVDVFINSENLGYGEGKTKKAAQQKAAQQACIKLKI